MVEHTDLRGDLPKPARRWRDTLLMAGLFGLMLIGVIGLAFATGWEETRAQLATLGLVQIAVLLGLSLINYLGRGLRWHLFARRLGLGLSRNANMRIFLGGFAMSVTPGRVGELVRMRWIRRETGWTFERTAPLMLVDRAWDLAAMGLLLGLALVFSTTGITGGVPVTFAALIAAFAVTRPSVMARIATWGHRATGRFARLFAKLRRASRSLSSFTSLPLMGAAALIGLLGWGAEGYAFHLLLTWMGADIGLASAVAIFVFSTLAGGLTGAPGGVGGAEAAMVALLALQGVPLETSLPATLIIRVTTLWFAIALGVVFFPIAERISKRGQYALETH
ncbi:MAG: lysylphosphatidylglycerol synthase transmembrane domain-containing protein [Maritimibacter sp.]